MAQVPGGTSQGVLVGVVHWWGAGESRVGLVADGAELVGIGGAIFGSRDCGGSPSAWRGRFPPAGGPSSSMAGRPAGGRTGSASAPAEPLLQQGCKWIGHPMTAGRGRPGLAFRLRTILITIPSLRIVTSTRFRPTLPMHTCTTTAIVGEPCRDAAAAPRQPAPTSRPTATPFARGVPVGRPTHLLGPAGSPRWLCPPVHHRHHHHHR